MIIENKELLENMLKDKLCRIHNINHIKNVISNHKMQIIQKVHIIEPYWNSTKIEQIIGRSIRHCATNKAQIK